MYLKIAALSVPAYLYPDVKRIMADNEPDDNPTQKRRNSDQLRLQSWKAIANHLNRSVRTVRRWESTEGLPVHRHRHIKGFSVYSFQSELDAWQADHHETLADFPVESPASVQHGQLTRWRSYAALLIVAIVIGGVAGRYVLPARQLPDETIAPALSQFDDVAYWPESVAQVLVAPVFSAWSDGRVHDAFRETQSVAQRLPALPTEVRGYVTDYLVGVLLSLGRIDDATALVANLPDGDLRNRLNLYVSFAGGDKSRARQVLEAGNRIEGSSAARSNVLLAMTAMQLGDVAEAKARLEDATSELVVEDQGYYFIALDMLSAVFKIEGNLTEAINVLERTMPQREFASYNRSGVFWLLCQRQLATLYRETGREADAAHLENELRDRLVLADDAFPLVQSLAGA